MDETKAEILILRIRELRSEISDLYRYLERNLARLQNLFEDLDGRHRELYRDFIRLQSLIYRLPKGILIQERNAEDEEKKA